MPAQRVKYCAFLTDIIMFPCIVILVYTSVLLPVVLVDVDAKLSTSNMQSKETQKASVEHYRVSTNYCNTKALY
jgi:hypothetical protein